MFGNESRQAPQKLDFLLLPNFSMLAFTSSIEPLRSANLLSDKTLYQWKTLSADGGAVRASNGVVVTPDASLHDDIEANALFVCAGLFAEKIKDRKMSSRLRDYERARVALGSVCTGSIALAQAGLLDGYRCTIHWQNVESFVEAFPKLNVTATVFEIDRDRYTCSGGAAPLDMMIYSISKDHDDALATAVGELMLHNFVRQPHDPQRLPLQHRTGIDHPKILAAIAHMEAYIETPAAVVELAATVDLSPRQLERLFRSVLNKTPTRYYLELRLQKAKLLLMQSSMPILQIAVATGFTSAAHFAKSYRNYFDHSPSAERLMSGRQTIERVPKSGNRFSDRTRDKTRI